MTNLVHIADRLLNRPLLITRDKAQVIMSVLAGRIGIEPPTASRFEGENVVRNDMGRGGSPKPYNVSNGVGIITITGSLVNRGAWIGANSGLTSYEGIQHQLKTALADSDVHSVILDLHSPGGEAVGAFETADIVRQVAASKRTLAVVNGMAASAAYAIASGANDIITTETGVSGSVGVVLLHADFSRQLDREGITPTLIHAGAHKVDGNPFEPLAADVRDDLQAEVNSFYDAFLSTVAKGRGSRLTATAARKTEARTLIGKAAVAAGLADRVGTFETALAELTRAKGRTTPKQGKSTMTVSEDFQAGAAAERERFKAVMTSAAYKGREGAAQNMLHTTDMTAEQIIGVLGSLDARASGDGGRGPMGISTISAPMSASKTAALDPSAIYASRREATQQYGSK